MKIPKIKQPRDKGYRERFPAGVEARDKLQFSQANKMFDFGRLVERDEISYLKVAGDFAKEVEAEKRRKEEERIWIEVKTIEEARAREHETKHM